MRRSLLTAPRLALLLAAATASAVAGCAPAGEPPEAAPGNGNGSGNGDENGNGAGDELALGELPDDFKSDASSWGDALKCKPVPNVPGLVKPEITISLHGQTLHLVDRAGTYDRVFPIGPGAIDQKSTDREYGESFSYFPNIVTGRDTFTVNTATAIQPCKTWWTDPDTGARKPVFAGLPFISWYGNYGMHGPIDNFTAPNGGTLRRGFVSHGCARMAATDIVEVYARVRGVKSFTVKVQREPERDALGRRVDLVEKWVGAECAADGDCNFAGGFCHRNKWSGRGFCTMRCTGSCPDRANLPGTFCVADPDSATTGMCVSKEVGQNLGCRNLDHFVQATVARFSQPSVKAKVCIPGTPGWIGDHCFAGSDCKLGTSCAGATSTRPGLCTQACALACPDQPGYPFTTCVAQSSGAAAACGRVCTLASNASECPAGTACVSRVRPDGKTRYVCTPQ